MARYLTTKNKVLLLGDGLSHHFIKIANYLYEKEYCCYVASSRYTDGYNGGISKILLDKPYKNKYLNFLHWIQLIKFYVSECNFKIIDTHFITVSGWLAYLSGFRPYILNVWGNDITVDPYISPIYNLLTRKTISNAHTITTVSNSQYEQVFKFRNSNNIVHIPFGVNCDIFKPYPKLSKTPTIGVVKWLEPTYGIEYLIAAVPAIKQKYPDLKVLIIGNGSLESGFKQRVLDLQIQDNVSFLGKINNEYLPQYLSQMDIFIMPTIYESFGVAALEAQAMGIPVIASNVGGIPEVVVNNVTGILIEPKNPGAISQAVLDLLDNPEKRRQMGINARNYVLREYQAERWLNKRIELYETLMQ